MMVFLRVVQIKMAAATSFGADPLGPLAARCALVTAKPECVREGASLSSTGPRPTSSGRNRMASSLRPVTVAPKGMGLYDFVALQEGFFAAEGLDVDLDWKTFRGTQSSWKELAYFQRPQDRPYTQDKREVIQAPASGARSATPVPAWARWCPMPTASRLGRSSCGPTRASAGRKTSRTCRSRSACAREATSTCRIGWRNICRSKTSRW